MAAGELEMYSPNPRSLRCTAIWDCGGGGQAGEWCESKAQPANRISSESSVQVSKRQTANGEYDESEQIL